MKKLIITLLIISSTLYGGSRLGKTLSEDHTYEKQVKKEQGIEIVDGWLFLGDIRAGWVEYGYNNPPKSDGTATHPNTNQGHINSHGIYTMPKLSIMSPKDSKIRAKVTVAGATDFGINDEKYESRTFVFDATDKEPYIILQESYLSFDDGNHRFLVGREEISTPMVDSDDWYMLANSFELAYYTNKDHENITFNLGYFAQMAGVWDSGTKGTEFNTMADASYLDERDKKNAQGGVAFISFEYKDNKKHNLQAWNYYAFDLYNTLFLQYDYTSTIGTLEYDAGAQIINFIEQGGNKYTPIDYTIFSARFDGHFKNGINFATGISKYTDGEGQGATLGAFGGYPYFANGMIFHFFEAGSLQNAASYKAQIGYDFKNMGAKSLWIGYRLTYFDLDSNYSTNSNGQAQEQMVLNGIRVSYGKKTGTYFTGTYEHVNLNHEPNTHSLRLIGGYKF